MVRQGSRWFQVLSVISAVVFVSASCGDDDAANAPVESSPTSESVETEPTPTASPRPTAVAEAEPTPSAETGTTAPSGADVLQLGFSSCDRFGIGSRVSPEAARDYVPDDHELWLVGGQALVSLQTMSCSDLTTDGVAHGPGHFGTLWIRIVGPEEAVTLPMESDLVAQPTDSFYPPLFHTDNEDFRAASAAFGVPMTLADSMTFDPPREGTQSGTSIDLEFSPALSYRWTVDNMNRNDEGGAVGRHVLLGLDDQGSTLTYYGEFLHEPGWQGNVGTLELESGSAFEDLLGASVTGPVNGDPVTVDMVVFRDAG